MSYNFVVEFQARKGLGPEFTRKLVPICYDDIDPCVPEYIVKDWAKKDAEEYLTERDWHTLVFVEIYLA